MQKLPLFLLFALLFLGCVQKEEAKYCQVRIEGEGRTLNLLAEIADTPTKRETGLMDIEFLCENCSMLFVFEEEGEYPFWMKDTLIPLDIIFISESGSIDSIVHADPYKKGSYYLLYSPRGKIKYALEVNAGWAEKNGITAGSFFYKGCKDYFQQ